MNRKAIATKVRNQELIVAPGIYDLISAKMADRMGFDALYVTGYGLVASYLGLPDAGLATYTDMLSRISRMCEMTETPVMADADTGYGGLLNVAHTVKGYERAGVAAIQLEDQQFPKKCGHTPNRPVIAKEDMIKKIKVACDARTDEDFLIIARTDARAGLGLAQALDRAAAYGEAGADVLFVEAPESIEEMKQVCDSLNKPLLANMVTGGKTPVLPGKELKALGYTIAIHPAAGFLSCAAGLDKAFQDLKEHGTVTEATPMYDFSEFTNMIGFPDVWAFDKRYAED
jgi:2-methylisocitrate lyase-like PEP mutase family enzyme